ncbi:hypothetical protein ACFX2K_007753 [Malus domestica]
MGLNFQGANAVADARESGGEVSGTSGLPFSAKETVKEYEAKHQGLAMTSDPAKEMDLPSGHRAKIVIVIRPVQGPIDDLRSHGVGYRYDV